MCFKEGSGNSKPGEIGRNQNREYVIDLTWGISCWSCTYLIAHAYRFLDFKGMSRGSLFCFRLQAKLAQSFPKQIVIGSLK